MHATALVIMATVFGAGGEAEDQLYVPSILLSPIEHVEVAARSTGWLADVLVREGQTVQRDQLLAQIDDAEVQIAKQRAAIDLEIARESAANDVSIRLAKKSLAVAKAELQRAVNAVEKYKKSVPETELDKLRLTVERDALAVEQAEYEYRLARSNLRLKENDLKLASLEVEQRKIPAPFDGMIAEISRRRSEWVKPGDQVLRILRMDRLRAEGLVDAARATAGLVGRPVTLRVDLPGDPQAEFTGTVTFVSPEINPVNGQLLVWAEIENRDLLLRPGLRATMHISMPAAPSTD